MHHNERSGVDAGWAVLLAYSPAWPRTTKAERSAEVVYRS